MIRKTWDNDKWLLTAQGEHARLSAIFAASWKFPGHKPADEVFKAIMSHDDGWKETDALPQIKPNGDPRDFMEMRIADFAAISEKSIALRVEAGQPYAALLVAGHFITLAETADLARATAQDAIEAGRFIARTRKMLTALREEIAATDGGDAMLQNYDQDLRFLRVCDYLSLLLCSDFAGEEIITDVPYLESGNTLKVVRTSSKLALSISPLPFKKNVRDHLTSWIVPEIPYETSEELAAALEEVKTTTNEVHIGAAS